MNPMRHFAGIRSWGLLHAWWPLAVGLLCSGTMSCAQTPVPADINLFGDDFPPTMKLVGGRWVMVRKETAPKQISAGSSQTIVFRNGNELRGEILEVTDEELVWKRPDAVEALRFPCGMIRRVATDRWGNPQFEPVRPPANGAVPGVLLATVKLAGTDWICGETTSDDGKTFVIRVADWTLTVARSQMEWLYFDGAPAPAFGIGESEVDFEEWEPPLGAVRREGKSFTVKDGWLGRGIVPPRRFVLSIEVPEEGEDGTRLWLQPFGTRPDSWGAGTTQIQLGRAEISHLLFIDHIDPQKTPLPGDVQEKGPVQYRLYWEEDGKRVRVQRNGRLVGDWKYPADSDFHFEGICLDRVDGNDLRKPLKFNRVSVAPWDGVVSGPEERKVKEDRWIRSGMAEPKPGRLQSLSNRAMQISGVVQPLEAGTFLRLSGPPALALGDTEARVVLGSRGGFNARHLAIRNGKLECETAFARKLEVPLSAVSSIAFRPSPQGPSDPAAGDMLVFKNGDALSGKAMAASERDGVRWKTLTGQEVVFQPGRVAGIRLEKDGALGPGHVETRPGEMVVELRSGERLGGKLQGYDDREMRLETPLLGRIALERSRLWHLFPRLSLEAFGGNSSSAGWAWKSAEPPGPDRAMNGSSPVVALDGTYIVRTGTYAYPDKPNDLPGVQHTIDRSLEQFEVRFDAISPGGNTSDFMLILHGDNETTLTLDVTWWRLYAWVSSPGSRGSARRSVSFQDKIKEADLRRAFRLLVNTKAGTCDVTLNGTFMTRIGTERGERIPKANYRITLAAMPGSSGPTMFTNLWLGPWNGQLPKGDVPATGLTTLANGDFISSVPKTMAQEKFTVDSDVGELNLPLEEALHFDFGETVDPQDPVGQVRLKDGTLVNAMDFQWDGRSLLLHNAILGEVRLAGELVREIIYAPALHRARATVSMAPSATRETVNASGGDGK
jgi:hypothetical protein